MWVRAACRRTTLAGMLTDDLLRRLSLAPKSRRAGGSGLSRRRNSRLTLVGSHLPSNAAGISRLFNSRAMALAVQSPLSRVSELSKPTFWLAPLRLACVPAAIRTNQYITKKSLSAYESRSESKFRFRSYIVHDLMRSHVLHQILRR